MNATRVVAEGDASLTLSRLKVRDDGTYICTVSVGPFHAQQIVQLHVVRECQMIHLICLIRRSSFNFLLSCSPVWFGFVLFSEPPGLSLSEEKLIHKDKSPQILSCHSTKYFPLDAQVCVPAGSVFFFPAT